MLTASKSRSLHHEIGRHARLEQPKQQAAYLALVGVEQQAVGPFDVALTSDATPG